LVVVGLVQTMSSLLTNVRHNAPDEFKVAVALGYVPGWTAFRKYGMNDDVDSGTEELWPIGTLRVLPTTAAVASTVSSSVEDDILTGGAIAGTGAWTLVIEGLDSTYSEVSEEITLNGLGAVTTTQTFFRINRAYVVTAGTGTSGANAGNISISVGGNLQAYIETGQGQTHQTHYTVPASKTLVITAFHLTGGRMGNTDMQVWSQVKPFGTNTAWRTLDDTFMYQNNIVNDADVFIIPEKSEIRQRIVGNTVNGEVTCTWGGYSVHNERIPG
jgi:hypothetical protein